MTGSKATASRAQRGIIATALVALLLFLALTVGWYVLADQLDQRVEALVEAAASRGATLECADREVVGYPFRIGLTCSATAVSEPGQGVAARAGALRTAAQIYRPNRIVAELDAPLEFTGRDGTAFDARWDLLQASASFWTEGLDTTSVAVDGIEVARSGEGLVASDAAELHARRRGDDLDLASSMRGGTILLPALAELPPFDTHADLTVTGAADWLSDGAPESGLRGREGVFRALRLDMPGTGAEISGPFRFGEDGRLTGEFDLALTDPDALAEILATLVPELAGPARAVAQAVGLLARREEGRSVIAITVREGRASAGFIPLGDIPPLP